MAQWYRLELECEGKKHRRTSRCLAAGGKLSHYKMSYFVGFIPKPLLKSQRRVYVNMEWFVFFFLISLSELNISTKLLAASFESPGGYTGSRLMYSIWVEKHILGSHLLST